MLNLNLGQGVMVTGGLGLGLHSRLMGYNGSGFGDRPDAIFPKEEFELNLLKRICQVRGNSFQVRNFPQ